MFIGQDEIVENNKSYRKLHLDCCFHFKALLLLSTLVIPWPVTIKEHLDALSLRTFLTGAFLLPRGRQSFVHFALYQEFSSFVSPFTVRFGFSFVSASFDYYFVSTVGSIAEFPS